MEPTDHASRKYNVTLSRLIQTVVGMSEKEQLIMLRLAEELLYRHKKPQITPDTSAITRSKPSVRPSLLGDSAPASGHTLSPGVHQP